MIGRDRMVAKFINFVQIDSPGKAEREMAEAVQQALVDLGLRPYYDEVGSAIGGNCGNLIARLPATADGLPTVMLNAHLDTVAPSQDIRPVIEDDIIRSSGETILGADDKAGVVIILEVLRALVADNAPRGELIALFTVAEEIGLLGAINLDYSQVQADVAYVMDGGPTVGKMTTAAPYANRMVYTVKGKAAHAGVCPEQGINSILAASKGIAKMTLGRMDDESTANIGLIDGGTATNIVPEQTVATGEARSHSLQKLTDQTEHMAQCMREGAEGIGAEVEIEETRSYDGFAIPDSAPAVQWASAAAEALGFVPQTERGGGGSDANIFNAHGISAIIMATGARDPHTLQETLCISEMVDSARWLLETVHQVNSTPK